MNYLDLFRNIFLGERKVQSIISSVMVSSDGIK